MCFSFLFLTTPLAGQDSAAMSIGALVMHQKALQDQKKAVTKRLVNEKKKRKRTLTKVAGLSSDDLVAALLAKKAAEAKADQRASR